jgi:hypothetical protein
MYYNSTYMALKKRKGKKQKIDISPEEEGEEEAARFLIRFSLFLFRYDTYHITFFVCMYTHRYLSCLCPIDAYVGRTPSNM